MKLSMPIPFIELITVQKVLSTTHNTNDMPSAFSDGALKDYCNTIRGRRMETLSNLMELPPNYDPSNHAITAKYRESEARLEKSLSDSHWAKPFSADLPSNLHSR